MSRCRSFDPLRVEAGDTVDLSQLSAQEIKQASCLLAGRDLRLWVRRDRFAFIVAVKKTPTCRIWPPARVQDTMYQPFTTDTTTEGAKRARNTMRTRLWEDDTFAHMWLVHFPRNEEDCPDGCNAAPDAARAAFYQSEME